MVRGGQWMVGWKPGGVHSGKKTESPHVQEGPPKPQNLFIKESAFILTHLNFHPFPSPLRWMQCTYRDAFPLLNSL